MPKGVGYGFGRGKLPRKSRGVNDDVDRKSKKSIGKGGSPRKVTDGVDLKKGYGSVPRSGSSPNANANSANKG